MTISLSTETHEVVVGGNRVDLTVMELNLLSYLLKRRGTTVTRTELYDYCGMQKFFSSTSRPVDTHIQRLRKKLGKAAYSIKTVRGVGYRLEK